MKRGILVVAVLAAAACGDRNTIITGPNTPIVIFGPSGPGGPIGSTGPTGSIASVKVTEFGEERCPSGIQPVNAQREMRAGCAKPITCTPFRADGTKATPAEHGTTPEVFESTTPGVCRTEEEAEPFNKTLRGLTPGLCIVTCQAKGVVGANSWTIR
jgi:hypothetical protein